MILVRYGEYDFEVKERCNTRGIYV